MLFGTVYVTKTALPVFRAQRSGYFIQADWSGFVPLRLGVTSSSEKRRRVVLASVVGKLMRVGQEPFDRFEATGAHSGADCRTRNQGVGEVERARVVLQIGGHRGLDQSQR